MTRRLRVLLLTIAPPENTFGVRVVLHRHLVERAPFDVEVLTNARYFGVEHPHTCLRLPWGLERLRHTRLFRWVLDFEQLVWARLPNRRVDEAIRSFRPDVILTVADNSLSQIARQAARRHRLPLAGLFLDWVPFMPGYYGHDFARRSLDRQFRDLYRECALAICTSDGMRDALGEHPNAVVVHPMTVARPAIRPSVALMRPGRLRLTYVGSVQSFYGRMLCRLIEATAGDPDVELTIVGPDPDWPPDLLQTAIQRGVYLGFKPPEEAAEVIEASDAVLVVMSFETEHRQFMRTSFTTKLLDACSFGKPIVVWGPPECSAVRFVREHGGAAIVDADEPGRLVDAVRALAHDEHARHLLATEATILRQGPFDPDNLQRRFESAIRALAEPA